MIFSYFKTAWVNLRKYPLFSAITVGGLGIGVAAVLLIGLYIQSEMSFDRGPVDRASIYRVGFRTLQEGKMIADGPSFTAQFGVSAQAAMPAVASYCRLTEGHAAWLGYEGKSLSAGGLRYCDSSFLSFFSCRMMEGDAGTALVEPFSVVLTAHLAKALFGTSPAVGKVVSFDGKRDYRVTGVVNDAGDRTSLPYDALASLSSWYHDTIVFMGWNGGWQYQHYLRLRAGVALNAVEKDLQRVVQVNYNEPFGGSTKMEAYLQPFDRLHLFYNEDSRRVRTNLYVFGIIGLLILLISCINYVNLSVARAFGRHKEIGVRKVLGASRPQLVAQFIGETLAVTTLAVLMGIAAAFVLLPVCRQVLGRHLAPETGDLVFGVVLVVGLILLITFSAGAYLAFYLSGLRPVSTLKVQGGGSGKARFGRVLMVVQFTIAAGLISFLLVVSLQLKHMKEAAPGYDREHVLLLKLNGDAVQDAASSLRTSLAGIAGVQAIGALSEVPYNDLERNGFVPQGRRDAMIIHQLDADEGLLQVFGLHLVSGRFFGKGMIGDSNAYVINRTLAGTLDWKDPLGKTLARDGKHPVIGVIDDFHFASMREAVGPLIITLRPWLGRYGYLAVRYEGGSDPSRLIDQVSRQYKAVAMGAPLELWFLDEAYDRLYRSEEQFRLLFGCLSALAIGLSLAGVFGLSLIELQRRAKEIGIRKLLGAGTGVIIGLWLSKFGRVVVLSSLLAIVPAWYYSHVWLQDYANRIPLSWWIFGVSGLLVWFCSMTVVGVLAARAARANPAISLKGE